MMQLEFGGRRYEIPAGELAAGSDSACGLVLPGPEVQPRHALLRSSGEGSAVVQRATPEAVILVNGVRLGAEPAPVLHGDRIRIGEHELLVVDSRKSGSTQFMDAGAIAAMVSGGGKSARPGGPAPVSGGRLVCLTDGREYTIGGSLVFGREAGNDVVIENSQVSRRHAEIVATPEGYQLTDLSTNGTYINGQRISGKRTLARADMIRIGDTEFRFYADAAPTPPIAETPSETPADAKGRFTPSGVPAATPMSSGPVLPPAGALHRLNDTLHGQALGLGTPGAAPTPTAGPGGRPSSGAGVLASFLVRSGPLKGTRLPVRVPVVNIGRGDYNDVVLADDSVSTAHAKLQRREGIWILSDLGSTNGTFVDGEEVSGEVPLGPGVTVRFGQVSTLFEPTDDELGVARGTGTRMMEPVRPPEPAPAPAAAAAAPPPPPPPPAAPAATPRSTPVGPERPVRPAPRRPPVVVTPPVKSGGSRWVIPVLLLIGLAALAYFLLNR